MEVSKYSTLVSILREILKMEKRIFFHYLVNFSHKDWTHLAKLKSYAIPKTQKIDGFMIQVFNTLPKTF